MIIFLFWVHIERNTMKELTANFQSDNNRKKN